MSSVVQVYGENNAADMDNNNTDDSSNEANLEIKQTKHGRDQKPEKGTKQGIDSGLYILWRKNCQHSDTECKSRENA